MAIFRISGVWHVGWWNLITSVRLIHVANNRNDHFRYFLGAYCTFASKQTVSILYLRHAQKDNV